MTFSGVDWTILWKFYHLRFFWIYLTVGIPIKSLLARRLETDSAAKTSAFALLASLASSACNTWFPILPISCGLIVDSFARHAVGQSLFTVPAVAVAMGVQAASLDYLLVRIFRKRSVKMRFMWMLVANVLSASIALGLGFVSVAYHPITVFDIARWGAWNAYLSARVDLVQDLAKMDLWKSTSMRPKPTFLVCSNA
jgi:hypothetical protein